MGRKMTGVKVDPYFDRTTPAGTAYSILTRSRGTGPLLFWTGTAVGWTSDIQVCKIYSRFKLAEIVIRRLHQPSEVWTHQPTLTAHCVILPSDQLYVDNEYALHAAWLDPARVWGNRFWRVPMRCPVCHGTSLNCQFVAEEDQQQISCVICGHRVGCSAHPRELVEFQRWAALQDAIEIWNAQHWLPAYQRR